MKPPKIESTAQLAALATALEQRAALRFRLMARQAQDARREDLFQLFSGLAEQKDSHCDRVSVLTGLQAADLPGVPAGWLDGFDGAENDPAAAETAHASPYLALAEAVRGEERVFAFFSYIAAETQAPAVMDLAETLAREKLQQAHDLRQARRKAYRRFLAYDRAWPGLTEINSLEALEIAAAQGEAALLHLTNAWRDRLPVLAEIEASLLEQFPGLTARSEGPPGAANGDKPPDSPEAALRTALDKVQTAFEYYDAVATIAERQDVMLKAQELTAMSLERIKALGAALLH